MRKLIYIGVVLFLTSSAFAQKGMNLKLLRKCPMGANCIPITGVDSLQYYVLADTSFIIGLGQFVLTRISANTNQADWNNLDNIPIGFADDIDNVDDGDTDDTNELDSKWTANGSGGYYLTDLNGTVAIGTNAPAAKLTIVGGDIKVNGLTLGSGGGQIQSNTTFGLLAGNQNTGNNNVMMGHQSGRYNAGNNNVFLGSYTGLLNSTGQNNVFIAPFAGFGNTTGQGNTFIGVSSGQSNKTGTSNTSIGYVSGFGNTTGSHNSNFGHGAGYGTTTGSYNTNLGMLAGRRNSTSSNNTFVGYRTGYEVTGGGNVMLGAFVGEDLTSVSNRLYIDNSDTPSPLMYGEFDNDLLRINGTLNINNAFSFPTIDGTSGQVLQTNGSGILTWGSSTVSETDPVFVGSAANGISNSGSGLVTTPTERANWDSAFGWGDHTGLYESTFSKNTAFNKDFGTDIDEVMRGNTTTIQPSQSNAISINSAKNTYPSADATLVASALQPEDTLTGGKIATKHDLNSLNVAGDNLGNHTASMILNMSQQEIQNASGISAWSAVLEDPNAPNGGFYTPLRLNSTGSAAPVRLQMQLGLAEVGSLYGDWSDFTLESTSQLNIKSNSGSGAHGQVRFSSTQSYIAFFNGSGGYGSFISDGADAELYHTSGGGNSASLKVKEVNGKTNVIADLENYANEAAAIADSDLQQFSLYRIGTDVRIKL